MPISGPGYQGPPEVHYLFIDGGALRGHLKNISEKWFGHADLRINFRAIAQGFTKTFYYDAVPVREEREAEDAYIERIKPNREVLDAASAVDGLHVYEGDARRQGRGRGRLVQKKVDVMLTVDMLTHAFHRNMHRATLLSGDNDFKPLIDGLVQHGMFVTLWYPVGGTSRELIQSADRRNALTMLHLHRLLTPESQPLFKIPSVRNLPPDRDPGLLKAKWIDAGKEICAFVNNSEYTITQENNALNRLNISSDRYDLLRFFCRESLNLEIPEAL